MRKTNTIRLAVPLVLLLLINSCSKKELSANNLSNKTENQKDPTGGLMATQRALGNSEIIVVGKGYLGESDGKRTSFTINASRKTNGTISGHMSFTSSYLDFSGDVDCISMVEGKLIITGVIKQLSKSTRDFAYIGIRFQFAFEDNGDGTSAPPDRMSGAAVGGPFGCETGINLATPNEIQGNIQIIQ